MDYKRAIAEELEAELLADVAAKAASLGRPPVGGKKLRCSKWFSTRRHWPRTLSQVRQLRNFQKKLDGVRGSFQGVTSILRDVRGSSSPNRDVVKTLGGWTKPLTR